MKEMARIHEIEKSLEKCRAMIERLTPQAIAYNDARVYDQLDVLDERIKQLDAELATLNA